MKATKNIILLAEDNDGDVFLVRRALEKRGLSHELVVAHNGEEAMLWLNANAGQEERHVTPNLILLDLNLPRVDGGQLLSHIRKTDTFSRTPVIVLTSDVDELHRVRDRVEDDEKFRRKLQR